MTQEKKTINPKSNNYSQSILLIILIILLGFILNIFLGKIVSLPSYPINLVYGISFTISIILCFVFFRKTYIISFLTSIPFTISILSGFTFLILIMGFIPQVPSHNAFIQKLGLNSMLYGFPFALILSVFLFVLGLIILKRMIPFSKKNTAFLLNHFGLWFCLLTAALGSGDVQKIKLTVNKNDYTYSGINQKGEHIKDLGIALKLKDFILDIYTPKAYIIDAKTGKLLNKKYIVLNPTNKVSSLDWEIEVLKYYEHSSFNNNQYYAIYNMGSVPSAYIKCTHNKTKESIKSWISCGNFMNKGAAINLGDNKALVMGEPEPKKFTSKVKILTNQQESILGTIEVNKPLNVGDWKIYQVSYNQEKGRWSQSSVLELVKDPWLHYVYFGFYLLLAGALLLFWQGNKKTNTQQLN